MSAVEKKEFVLSSDDVRLGSVVIINEIDRPCARLLVVVIGIDGDMVQGYYLAKSIQEKRNGCSVVGGLRRVVPVSLFGLEVVATVNESSSYKVRKVGESLAKYSDGSPRLWQDPFSKLEEIEIEADEYTLAIALRRLDLR